MKVILFVGGVLAAVLFSGCRALPKATQAREPHLPIHQTPQEPVPAARFAPDKVANEASPPEPAGDLSLEHAVRLSLANNPKLRAFRLQVQRAAALKDQAGSWSNPEISAEVENIGGSGDYGGTDAAEYTISLAQTFPLGRDIARRRDLGAERIRLANWDFEAARLEVMVEVTKRFIEALAADRRLALAKQELDLARSVAALTEQRVEAGDASPVEVTRVTVSVITAKLDLEAAERLRDAAYRRLSLAWGGLRVTFDRAAGDLDRIVAVPEPSLLAAYINKNPAVARWTAEIGEKIAERRLAEAEAIPDVTARIGAKSFNESDDTAFVFELSLPLPVFDRREGDIRAARKGAMAATERQRETQLEIEGLLSGAYAGLLNAYEEALALRQQALPAAERAHDATRRAFEEGKLTYLDVLDAQRTLFDLQRRYLDALVVYHAQTAEIESLIGQPLSNLTNPQNEESL